MSGKYIYHIFDSDVPSEKVVVNFLALSEVFQLGKRNNYS